MRGEVRAGRREGVGWRRRKRHARGRTDPKLGARARAERTLNMAYMLVTLEVSKLSGWLNALAICRESQGGYTPSPTTESKGGHGMREEVRPGRREGGGGSGVHGEVPTQGWGARARAKRT